ncbi:TadE/TadG family type IV pilus assembly protein [Sphingomonas jatrophae]|uniref:TadE-like protein n=1 Tax=Sphingomonas jatrophae TaxID=1166337 RepID=A0A1I6JJ99_9SPHN|nr:TadE/TadG family type IV pilus assembly protein [Sphingomonas jatrophae]SFR79013.1 TadE-like protein [Sphingomonas jatrophae]
MPVKHTARTLRALAADRSGLALIEWAISLPVLLTLGLGGIEVAHFAIANLRISQIAATTADNAARVRDEIDEIDINELFAGAKFVGRNIDFAANGRIILSDVEATSDGKQWMRWQRCSGALQVESTYGEPMSSTGAKITSFTDSTKAPTDYGASSLKWTATQLGPTGNQIATAQGTATMLVEVVYDYQPLVANRFLGTRRMRYTGAFNVRQRVNQTLNRASLTATQMSTCGKYAA